MTRTPPEPLTDFDSLMVRFDGDPRMRSHAMAVMLLDRPPDWERVVAAFDAASRRVPRLRQHIIEPALRQFLPWWVVDPNFDLSYHVRRIALPSPGSTAQLLELAANYAMPPMDPSRPRWEVVVVEGLQDGSAALLFKSHHALWDGLGFISFLDGFLDKARDADPAPLGPAPEGNHISPVQLVVDQLRDAVHGLWLIPKAFGALAKVAVTPNTDAVQQISGSLKQAGDLVRLLVRTGETPPLLRSRNVTWQFCALEVPLQDFRAAARAADSTLNDVFVAGIAGGVRRYYDKLGVRFNRVTIGVAVSIRREDDPELGNRFAAGLLSMPLDISDPLARIRWTHAAVLAQRAAPYEVLSAAAPVINRWLPSALAAPLLARQVTSVEIASSNVPGLRERRYLAGAEVTQILPFGPAGGYPVQAALVSHAGTCCIGLNCNGAGIADADVFTQSIQAGIDEVIAVGGTQNATKLIGTSSRAKV